MAAQSPAGNIEQPAEDMLRGCARLTPGPARAEYRAWLAARPVGSAVAELLAAARGEDALLRGLAFEALRVVGAPAEPEVRAAVDEPSLRPVRAALARRARGRRPRGRPRTSSPARRPPGCGWTPRRPSPTTARPRCWCATWSPPSRRTVPALLDEVRAVGHPRTVQVLVALAAAHPDPALAKAVRRAAFQVHTGGA